MRAERPILLRFLNVLTSLNGFINERIVFLFLVKYIASGTLKTEDLLDHRSHSYRSTDSIVKYLFHFFLI